MIGPNRRRNDEVRSNPVIYSFKRLEDILWNVRKVFRWLVKVSFFAAPVQMKQVGEETVHSSDEQYAAPEVIGSRPGKRHSQSAFPSLDAQETHTRMYDACVRSETKPPVQPSARSILLESEVF